MTPGEVLQLSPEEALVLVSGTPPIRARKLKYYSDRNFLARRLPVPRLAEGRYADLPAVRGEDWSGRTRAPHPRLEKAWSELVTASSVQDEAPPRTREIPLRRKKSKDERQLKDLPLFAWEAADRSAGADETPAGSEINEVVRFPGLRL